MLHEQVMKQSLFLQTPMQCHSDLETEDKGHCQWGECANWCVQQKTTFFGAGKNLLFRRKLYSVKVHMGYADISFIFKGGCSTYEMRKIKRLRNFSPLHLENKYIRLLHSDLPSLNLKGSGKKRTVQALYPLQLALCVPTSINSKIFTTAISPFPEKGAKRTNTCRLQMWQ